MQKYKLFNTTELKASGWLRKQLGSADKQL